MNNTKKIIILKPEPLTKAGFAPYGQVILGPFEKPNYKGNNWTSLFPAAQANISKGELGWVLTKSLKKEILITGMEREPEIEIIWPVTGPIIQTVASGGDLNNHAEQPDSSRARAFIIQPGQVIIMHPGTWHYAAFPGENKEVLYYFMTKDHPREPGWENVPWVPLKGNAVIKIKL